MLSDDTCHFALSVWRKTPKTDANSNGRVGALVTKFIGCRGAWRRPDNPRGKCRIRCARFMGPGVALALCGGEVQCCEATQKFRASLEVKAGPVPAEIHRQRRQTVRVTDMID